MKKRLKGKEETKKEKKSDSKEKASSSGSDKDVVVLTESNYADLVLGSKDIWLVEFYAPWCGHCKQLEPEWNEAAAKLKGTVKLGKVDATVETGLASKYGIKGYPTIKYFNYGLGKTDSSA